MPTIKKSVFLYGFPTSVKRQALKRTQTVYTDEVNRYIELLLTQPVCYLALFNNQNQAPCIRQLEKQHRNPLLGSAYGQNVIDHAVKELHNHFTRIKNKLYGHIANEAKPLLPYIQSIAVLNASLLDTDEVDILKSLLDNETEKKKPNKKTVAFYTDLLKQLHQWTAEERSENRAEIRMMFHEKLDHWKIPLVKKATVQLDSRLCNLIPSHSTSYPYILSVKLVGEKERVDIPIETSRNGLRRMNQYKTGSLSFSFVGDKLKVTVPFDKKTEPVKVKKKCGIDIGITDLFYTSDDKRYGSFTGMTDLYNELVQPKQNQRAKLHSKMREYQKELRSSRTHERRKEWLRTKIHHIAGMLNGTKKWDTCKRRYAHAVDVSLNEAVKGLFSDIQQDPALSVLESLDITDFDRGKKANKRDSMWVRGQLVKKLKDLLDWHGLPYEEVDPAYTSKCCHKCLNIDDRNRLNKRFVCTVCKHACDADYNASINIANRAGDEELQEIIKTYDYNTILRHRAIKALYLKRHQALLPKLSVLPIAK